MKIKRDKKGKINKAIALSQVFSLLVEIFAVCFIMSMSFAFSADVVSGDVRETLDQLAAQKKQWITESITPTPVPANRKGNVPSRDLAKKEIDLLSSDWRQEPPGMGYLITKVSSLEEELKKEKNPEKQLEIKRQQRQYGDQISNAYGSLRNLNPTRYKDANIVEIIKNKEALKSYYDQAKEEYDAAKAGINVAALKQDRTYQKNKNILDALEGGWGEVSIYDAAGEIDNLEKEIFKLEVVKKKSEYDPNWPRHESNNKPYTLSEIDKELQSKYEYLERQESLIDKRLADVAKENPELESSLRESLKQKETPQLESVNKFKSGIETAQQVYRESLKKSPAGKAKPGTTTTGKTTDLFSTTLGQKEGPKYTLKSDQQWYDAGGTLVEDADLISKLKKSDEAYKYYGSGKATSQFFGWQAGGTMDTITTGLEWGVYAFGISKVINEFAGMFISDWGKDKQNALTAAFTAGAMVYKSLDIFSKGGAGSTSKWYGKIIEGKSGIGNVGKVFSPVVLSALAAYFAFAAFYKDVKTHEESIEFKCMTWQAPRGGSDCDKCNNNPLKPCSEYRCKALGQTCKLINAGTGFERCIDSARGDTTSPGIKEDKNALTPGYEYSDVKPRPAGSSSGTTSGMKIKNPASEKGCLKAFTPFTFGIITTDIGGKTQPAQCKIEYNHTKSFDEMGYFMGDENKFTETHSQAVSLPGTDNLNASFPGVKNDGEYTFYIRCKDGNGNENKDEFAVRFCIDKTPDLNAPEIKATSIPSNSPVLYKSDNISIAVYTNEPANCKWSRKDADYSNMENPMECLNRIEQMNAELLYTCTTTLTAIKDKADNDFYFRCEDTSPQLNQMKQSYKYKLIGTQPLTILSSGPNETIGSSTATAIVNLNVKTDNGYKNGEATCYYSLTGAEASYQQMLETGRKNIHSQPLDLPNGDYRISYQCVDAGGNSAYSNTSFSVFVDKIAPLAVRVYYVDGKIKLITDEDSSCKYSTDSCNFDLSKEGLETPYDDSKEHWIDWVLGKTYYVKCKDSYNNQPDPTECTEILRGFSLPERID